MTQTPPLHPVQKAINRPLTIWGAERRLFFVALIMGATTFNCFGSLLGGLAMFAALYAFARWATAVDPEILRIVLQLGAVCGVLRSAQARSRAAKGAAMTRLGRVFADYREAGSLEGLVHIDSAVDRRTFLTHSGDLLTVLKATPQDADCLDAQQLDWVARRFEGALRSLDESFRVRQYLLKRPFPGLPRQTYSNPVLHRAAAARAAYFEQRADELCEMEAYVVLAYTCRSPEMHPALEPC